MTKRFDAKLLSPIRLNQQPDVEVEIIPKSLRTRLELRQGLKNVEVKNPQKFIGLLEKSVGRVKADDGSVQFLGKVRGGMVLGSGDLVEGRISATGKVSLKVEQIPFVVRQQRLNNRDATELLNEFDKVVGQPGVQAIFEPFFKQLAEEAEGDGRTVIKVRSPHDAAVVDSLKPAGIISRTATKLAFTFGWKRTGLEIGDFGQVGKKGEAESSGTRVRGLLKGD